MKKFKLTIELVPQTSWYSNVRSHVSSGKWEAIKKVVFGRAGYKCEVCRGRGLKWPVEAHEIFEYDDFSKTQTLTNIVALCPDCHAVKHLGRSIAVGQKQKCFNHFTTINQCLIAESEEYMEQCFEAWEERSKHEWKLNLSFLEREYGSV